MKGQADVIFYSEGPMYVKYKEGQDTATKGEKESTTLYIQGSAKFANGSVVDQKGRTEITQDFINAKDPATEVAANKQLFINTAEADPWNTGVVAFVGKGNAYDDNGTTKYMATLQRIYGVIPSGSSATIEQQKTDLWMKFPTISVEKGLPTATGDDWRDVGYLMVDHTAALSVFNVNAPKGDRFAVDVALDGKRRMVSGHAKIYNTTANTYLPGYSQVNWNMYNYNKATSVDDGKFDNATNSADPSTHDSSLRNSEGWNYLTGFTSPFAEMGADYLFYHALTKPNGGSMTSYEGPIVNPFYRLQKGVGYFHSMEVSNHDDTEIDLRWDFDGDGGGPKGVYHDKRARGRHILNRMVFLDYLSSDLDDPNKMGDFSRFVHGNTGDYNVSTDNHPYFTTRTLRGTNDPKWIDEKIGDRSRYEVIANEKFNTKTENGTNIEVTVDLKHGLNFLGNPFMAPISLNPLLGYDVNKNPTETDNDKFKDGVSIPIFTPSGGPTVTVSSESTAAHLRSKYWLINEALIKYDKSQHLFLYRAKYDFISRDGSSATNTIDPFTSENGGQGTELYNINPLDYRIAPMQMFCLQASRDVTIKLDMDLCAFGKTNFLKSGSVEDAAGAEEIMRDWFIVEVEGQNKSVTPDRTSVIFREDAYAQFNEDPYDTRKGLTKEIEEYIPEYNGQQTLTKMTASRGIVYTRSTEGINLLGNGVPQNTKELGLYFVPPTETQEMTLRFYGLENLESVAGVWLIDRHLNNKIVKIDSDYEYSFVSNPSDYSDAENENRFILRFYETDTDIIGGEDEGITAYYKESTLYIKGLNEEDINSSLEIYDMQGRLIARTKVDKVPMDYFKPLSLGTYIVKISGKRNFTSKFVNLRN